MMRLRCTVFGREICAVELLKQTPEELLAEVIDGLEEESPAGITGGPGGAFERDDRPYTSDDRYEPWEDRRFGFHG